MNKQDLNALTEAWHSDTNWLNDKVDEMFKAAQDHAYALGISRGLNRREVSDSEILEASAPFGEFAFGDAQGHQRIAFARAVLSLATKEPPP